jgi:hypothetical protein
VSKTTECLFSLNNSNKNEQQGPLDNKLFSKLLIKIKYTNFLRGIENTKVLCLNDQIIVYYRHEFSYHKYKEWVNLEKPPGGISM